MLVRSSLRNASALLLLITAIGVIGYMVISGMSFIDAFYMTAITLSTVGYREVVPLTPVAQLFTVALIFSGLGVVLYGASLVAGDVIEGRLQRVFGRRRVQRQIEQLADHYVVCGFGRMGRIVCKELTAKPARFVVVEKDPDAIRHIEEEGHLYVDGDATEDAVLTQAGIARARGLVSALSRDEDNVYVVLSARQLNPDLLIVARAEDERSETKLLRAGATRVVSPYVIGGSRMAGALLRPAVLDVIDLATHHRSIELKIEELAVAPGRLRRRRHLARFGSARAGRSDRHRHQEGRRRDGLQPRGGDAHRCGRPFGDHRAAEQPARPRTSLEPHATRVATAFRFGTRLRALCRLRGCGL